MYQIVFVCNATSSTYRPQLMENSAPKSWQFALKSPLQLRQVFLYAQDYLFYFRAIIFPLASKCCDMFRSAVYFPTLCFVIFLSVPRAISNAGTLFSYWQVGLLTNSFVRLTDKIKAIESYRTVWKLTTSALEECPVEVKTVETSFKTSFYNSVIDTQEKASLSDQFHGNTCPRLGLNGFSHAYESRIPIRICFEQVSVIWL